VTVLGQTLFRGDGETPIASIDVGGAPMEIGVYRYSPEYGVAVKAQHLWVRIPDLTNVTIRTVFAR
jgi:hypothetical protein